MSGMQECLRAIKELAPAVKAAAGETDFFQRRWHVAALNGSNLNQLESTISQGLIALEQNLPNNIGFGWEIRDGRLSVWPVTLEE